MDALRASEEQFRRAIIDAPIPVIMHAEDGQVLQISDTWTELTGYSRDEIPTFDAWLNVAYGPGAETVREHVHSLFSGNQRRMNVELKIKTRTGEARTWAFSASAPGTPRDGRRFGVGMALDITERRRTEEALRQHEERLRLIVDNANAYAIFSLDLQRNVTSWNRGGEMILQYSESEIIGRSGDIIFTPEDRAAGAPEEETRTALVKGVAEDERWHCRKDGSRFWGSGVMVPMHNSAREIIGFVKFFRDRTEEMLAKEALDRSRAELQNALAAAEQARREASEADRAKDHFLATLSHELRTPLVPIRMTAESSWPNRRERAQANLFSSLSPISLTTSWISPVSAAESSILLRKQRRNKIGTSNLLPFNPLTGAYRAGGLPKIAAVMTDTPSSTLRILLVENHADTLDSLKLYLEDSGHKVVTAMTIAAVEQTFRSSRFDVLLCDIGLPDGTGWDLMQNLVQSGQIVFATAMSGFGMNADSAKSRHAGFRQHLPKPFRGSKLDELLNQAPEELDSRGPAINQSGGLVPEN